MQSRLAETRLNFSSLPMIRKKKITEMNSHLRKRNVRFFFDKDCLVREITSDVSDRKYRHRCDLETFEKVAHAIEEMAVSSNGITLPTLVEYEGVPYSQANVAIEFLKDRGILEVRLRRSYPIQNAYLEAMTEWHALALADVKSETE